MWLIWSLGVSELMILSLLSLGWLWPRGATGGQQSGGQHISLIIPELDDETLGNISLCAIPDIYLPYHIQSCGVFVAYKIWHD